jgi:hypothetical protein
MHIKLCLPASSFQENGMSAAFTSTCRILLLQHQILITGNNFVSQGDTCHRKQCEHASVRHSAESAS